ncbi:37392_t:CDS:2 [Gigaspora margarita]|uniref:37392_t:CDS:1 n=1 Tax=Gigaspora margarita TaxID=4874 RepID=A0ABN7VG86_GIGMA|nr:37392_t:CDS:2 [Gigaspora margarita]
MEVGFLDDTDVLESTFSFEERDLILTDDEANNDKASNKPDNEPEEEEFGEEPGEVSDDESEALTDEEDIVTNVRYTRKWRYRLTLLKVHQHDLPICKQKLLQRLYLLSLYNLPLAHLERVLNNPTFMPKLYFGPGVIREEKDEFWHGNLWCKIPLLLESMQ